jgi:hypothetical protein
MHPVRSDAEFIWTFPKSTKSQLGNGIEGDRSRSLTTPRRLHTSASQRSMRLRIAVRLSSRTPVVGPPVPTDPVLMAVTASDAACKWFSSSCASCSRLAILHAEKDFEFLLDQFISCQAQPLRETIGQLLSRVVQMNTTTPKPIAHAKY